MRTCLAPRLLILTIAITLSITPAQASLLGTSTLAAWCSKALSLVKRLATPPNTLASSRLKDLPSRTEIFNSYYNQKDTIPESEALKLLRSLSHSFEADLIANDLYVRRYSKNPHTVDKLLELCKNSDRSLCSELAMHHFTTFEAELSNQERLDLLTQVQSEEARDRIANSLNTANLKLKDLEPLAKKLEANSPAISSLFARIISEKKPTPGEILNLLNAVPHPKVRTQILSQVLGGETAQKWAAENLELKKGLEYFPSEMFAELYFRLHGKKLGVAAFLKQFSVSTYNSDLRDLVIKSYLKYHDELTPQERIDIAEQMPEKEDQEAIVKAIPVDWITRRKAKQFALHNDSNAGTALLVGRYLARNPLEVNDVISLAPNYPSRQSIIEATYQGAKELSAGKTPLDTELVKTLIRDGLVTIEHSNTNKFGPVLMLNDYMDSYGKNLSWEEMQSFSTGLRAPPVMGLGAILKWFRSQNPATLSKGLLDEVLSKLAFDSSYHDLAIDDFLARAPGITDAEKAAVQAQRMKP